MLLIGNNHLDEVVGAAAVAAVLAAPKIDLFQTNIVVDRDTPLSSLAAAVATYTGYAQGVVTWSAVTISDDGQIEYLGTVPEFRPTGSVIANTIFGLYVTAAVGGALLFAGNFDNPPLPMGSALDSIIVTLRWRPQTGGIVAVVS